MRVPIPIVVILCLIAIGGVWWWSTHDRDFLRPPSAEAMRRIRPDDSSPGAGIVGPPQGNSPVLVSPRRAAALPRLDEFAEIARDSPEQLPSLAAECDNRGDFQRALLAHERIVDSTRVTGDALASSQQAARSLLAKLPPWNSRPDGPWVLTLHAATEKTNAARIEPVMERLAEEISRASHGILSVQPIIHRGPARLHGDLPPPVAVWIGGAHHGSPTTPVRSITLEGGDGTSAEIGRACLEIISEHLAKKYRLRVPLPTATDAAAISFSDRVTRLAWEMIGSSLNAPDS